MMNLYNERYGITIKSFVVRFVIFGPVLGDTRTWKDLGRSIAVVDETFQGYDHDPQLLFECFCCIYNGKINT